VLIFTSTNIGRGSHKVGDIIPESLPLVIGNGSQTVSFTRPQNENAKFSILHFRNNLEAGDEFLVEYRDRVGNPVIDRFDATSGATEFYTRPIRGDSPITFSYLDDTNNIGSVTFDKWGEGLGLINGGVDAKKGGNASGDIFLLDNQFEIPTMHQSARWSNVASLDGINDPGGKKRDAAQATGTIVVEHRNKVTTCSATLVDNDLLLTAAHCVNSGTEIPSGSFTVDFETNRNDRRIDTPGLYNPQFFKIERLVKTGWQNDPSTPGALLSHSGLDYAILQIDTGTNGVRDRNGNLVSPVSFKPLTPEENNGLPQVDDDVFIIHHPRGVPKRISPPSGVASIVHSISDRDIETTASVDNGSSGSSIFDGQGRVVGVATNKTSRGVSGPTAAAIQRHFSTDLPTGNLDAVIAFDRSGSMGLPSGLGTTKLSEAQSAAALFVDLATSGGNHRIGLVSFSTSATSPAPSPNEPLRSANQATRNILIGADKKSGTIGSLTADGLTSIGDGLRVAQNQLNNSSGNVPTVLLLTDGLHNTPPAIESVDLAATDTLLNIIGFGTEASLDGPRMTRLARQHGGLYTRAGDGLRLHKFFALSFGEIFGTSVSDDPFFVFPEGARTPEETFTFQIGGESEFTVAMGWENPSDATRFEIVTPSGAVISPSFPRTEGITTTFAEKWGYITVPLPFNGEREGEWEVRAERAFAQEFPQLDEEQFFLTTIVRGGPFMRSVNSDSPIYTGDTVNPLVLLRNVDGSLVDDAEVSIEVTRPDNGTGNILRGTGLLDSISLGGDSLDERTSTLVTLESFRGPVSQLSKNVFLLFDDALHGDGAMEEDGVFGNPAVFADQEGNYDFRAVARFADGVTRETAWTAYVEVGIDASSSAVAVHPLEPLPDGRLSAEVEFTPRDRLGNYLGPGRSDAFTLHLTQAESEFLGSLIDNKDGSYTQVVAWDQDLASLPGLAIWQEGRPLQIIVPEPPTYILLFVSLLMALTQARGRFSIHQFFDS